MAVIQSGTGTPTTLVVDPNSAAARVSLYDTAGNPISGPTGILGQVGLVDAYTGMRARVDVFRTVGTNVRTILLDNQPTATLDTVAWLPVQQNGGTVTSSSGVFTLATNSTASGNAALWSTSRARLISGTRNVFSMALILPDAGVTNNVRSWGVASMVPGSPPTVGDSILFVLQGTTMQGSYSIYNPSGTITTPFTFNVSQPTGLTGTWEIGYAQGGFEMYYNGTLIHVQFVGQVNAPPGLPTVFINPNFNLYMSNMNSAGSVVNTSVTILGLCVARLGEPAGRARNFYMNANGTQVISQGASTLLRVTINTAGGTNNKLTLYDNNAASGAVIGVIDASKVGNYAYGGNTGFDTNLGLTAVLAGGTAADVSIGYT